MTALPRVALVGSPNSGKTTLFNALTGLRHKVGNYPGVTVEHAEGSAQTPTGEVVLVDLPGTYVLDPISADEEVTVKVLKGEMPGAARIGGVVVVADATSLRRSLAMVAEVVALGKPTVLVLTMIDELKARKGAVKVGKLSKKLGVPVVGVVGHKGIGMDDLRALLGSSDTWSARVAPVNAPSSAVDRLAWADELVDVCVVEPELGTNLTDKIDRVVLHPVGGLLVFFLTMFLFFQVVFAWAAPLQDGFEWAVLSLGELLREVLPDNLIESLLVDGVIAGVGGVVVFLPQIALIMAMIAVLEGSGYMARAAFLIDRVMGWAGLEGRCFVALLSSYACAVPGIMATRSVPDPRSRLSTILVAPFMTCSARLPVYGLLIAAFIPAEAGYGPFNAQGLTLFGLYLLGSVSALVVSALFSRGLKRGRTFPFYMELPPYRLPTWRNVWSQVSRGCWAFIKKAGTIILAASMVLWVLLNFPDNTPPAEIADDETAAAAWQLEQSYAADVGKTIEPVIRPLGFDWKLGVGIVASLAAREVIVATMAQIYAFGGDEEDLEGLAERMRQARDPATGEPAYSLATALSLMVFFVFALQCVSTLAVMRRETNTWRWPAFAFAYMTALAWIASFATYQIASLFLA